MIRTVTLADVPEQPWRNGGGVTQELLVWPPAAGLGGGRVDAADAAGVAGVAGLADTSGWQLRISVARIERSGPFSAYPGVQRWFAVIAGAGVVLRFASRRVMLSAGSDPVRFDGASPPDCGLLDGATQDLNLMVRADAGSGALLLAQADQEWTSTAPLRAVFTAAACTLRIDDEDAAVLPAFTLAWNAHASHQRWRVSGPDTAPRVWWLQFKPRSP